MPLCYHCYLNSYYSPNYSLPFNHYVERGFPVVNPATFMSSARQMEILMRDASIVLQKMASSKPFSYELMSAAQSSNNKKVKELIRSTGINSISDIKYTPDGLRMLFSAKTGPENCCQLTLTLRWY